MRDDLNLKKLIQEAENGPIELPKPMYVFLPSAKSARDEDNKLITPDYMCSKIISIVKINNRSVNVSFMDLPKTYKGKKIDPIEDDSYNWHYETINPIRLSMFDGSYSWEDFK